MKNYKNVIKLTVGGILIFIFGLYMGSELDFTSLSSIEGYLYGANTATPSDATSGDATSGNATSGNATSGNATSGNATSGNATSGNATSSNVTTTTRPVTTTKVYTNAETKRDYLSSINSNKLDEFKNAGEGSNYIIEVDDDPFVKSDLFETIKGSDKTLTFVVDDNEMIFNGKDIVNPKNVNAYFDVQSLSFDKKIEEKLSSGFIIYFANDGTLPGKAKVRIKADSSITSELSSKNYVYYYNKSEDLYELIASNVQLTSDGYYEFNITHNSNYVITKEEIKDAEVNVNGKTKVSFQKSKTFQILLICGGVVVVIVVIVAVIIIKKKKNKTDKTQNDSEPEIPTTTNEFPWDKEQK